MWQRIEDWVINNKYSCSCVSFKRDEDDKHEDKAGSFWIQFKWLCMKLTNFWLFFFLPIHNIRHLFKMVLKKAFIVQFYRYNDDDLFCIVDISTHHSRDDRFSVDMIIEITSSKHWKSLLKSRLKCFRIPHNGLARVPETLSCFAKFS